MRLTPTQIESIRHAAWDVFGQETQVWLFGSRVDDSKRGGDIDLLVHPADPAAGKSLARKIRFLGLLERQLGERKIDVVIEAPDDARPIVQVAHETGVKL
jgi:predicted nucleotidyltransferase